jgi:hypothetical protein
MGISSGINMSDLVNEIKACDIECCGLSDGFPRTVPPYDQLSSGDQAIVNACIAAHGQAYGSQPTIDLNQLITQDQRNAYIRVRNMPYWVARMRKLGEGLDLGSGIDSGDVANAIHWLYHNDQKTAEDLEAAISAVWAEIPLWTQGNTAYE